MKNSNIEDLHGSMCPGGPAVSQRHRVGASGLYEAIHKNIKQANKGVSMSYCFAINKALNKSKGGVSNKRNAKPIGTTRHGSVRHTIYLKLVPQESLYLLKTS